MKTKTLKEKRTALCMLLTGKSQKEIADYFNIVPHTFSRWLKSQDCAEVQAEMIQVLNTAFSLEATDPTGDSDDA